MLRGLAALMFFLLPSLALAGRAEADACAAGLPVDAQKIYQATIPLVDSSTSIKRIARRQAALLARAGKIDSANTANSTLQARSCLRLSRLPRK